MADRFRGAQSLSKAKSVDSAVAAMDDLPLMKADSSLGLGVKRFSSAGPDEAVTLNADEKVEL